MKWKLYYEDGSAFTDKDGLWVDAPHRGAVLLSSEDPDVGREFDHGTRGEFFAWWPGATKPWGFDRTGIIDYLVEIGYPESTKLADLSMEDWGNAGVKVGRSVDNHVYREIMAVATHDPYLPQKSADTPREIIE